MYSFSEMNRVVFDRFSLVTKFVRSATKGKFSVCMLHETQKLPSKNCVPKIAFQNVLIHLYFYEIHQFI